MKINLIRGNYPPKKKKMGEEGFKKEVQKFELIIYKELYDFYKVFILVPTHETYQEKLKSD